MTSLKTLEFDHNQLSDLPEAFAALRKLEKLLLSANQFTMVPRALESLANLKICDLSHNQVSVAERPWRMPNNNFLGADYRRSRRLVSPAETRRAGSVW